MKLFTPLFAKTRHDRINNGCFRFSVFIGIALLLGIVYNGNAQTAYNPAKLAVLVVGDGTAALSGSATPVFVKEFNITGAAQPGTLRTTLPATATTGLTSVNRALTQSGSGTSEGYIGLSTNRQLLLVTGYNSSSGLTTVSSSVATTFPTNTRVIAKIDATGVADTKTTLNTTSTGFAIRSAASVDGTAYWTAGASGMNYVLNGNIAVPTSLSIINTRVASIFNNQLYTSSGSGSIKLGTLGTGLPTSGSPVLTNLNGFLTTTGDPYSYVFIDLNGSGPDVLYVASLSAAPSGLLKYTSSNNGTTWSAAGSLTGNVFGVTGVFNSCTGNVDLYITANTTNAKPTTLYKFSDLNVTVGSPAVITNNGFALTTFGTLLATAATNTAFGGVAFTPGTSLSAPSLFNVTGGNACFGSTVAIGLSNSETGINYELKKDGLTISTLPGTGAPLSFGSQSAAGVYTVVATNLLTGCTTNMAGSSVINSLPSVSFSGLASQYCITSSAVSLTGSPAGGTFSGPGISGYTFYPAITGAGGPYTITYSYTDILTGCSNAISQQVSVNVIPTVSISATPATVCAGNTANLTLNFTGTGPWTYSINGAAPVSTSSNPETVPVNPAVTTIYELTALKDANCLADAWVDISAGDKYSHGIKADGTLWTWGLNIQGYLGDGTTIDRNKPVKIGSATNWAKVSLGEGHSLAIRKDGTLWAWGRNAYGELGDGTLFPRYSPVQIGSATNWADIFCTAAHTLALKTDGTLWAWGLNVNGELGDTSFTDRYSPVQIGISTDWATISGGQYFSMGIKSDGTRWGWGGVSFGELGGGISSIIPVQRGVLSNWSKIFSGNFHNMAIQTNGTLWAWGLNTDGQLGDGTIFQRNSPVQIGSATNWAGVSAERYHSMAIKTDGTLWVWGKNTNGQVGDGTNTNRNSPVQIGNSTDWTKMVAGISHSLGIRSGGELWAWGQNANGQLGDGTNVDKNTPVQISSVISSVTVTVNPLPIVSFTGLASNYCVNASPVSLTGTPVGGTFSGPGVSGNTFNPALAGSGGTYTITYSYTNIATGCSNSSSQTVNIIPLPVVTFSGLTSQYCLSSSPVTLTGSPAGGTFSGPGINGNNFNPAIAGAGGPYTITYAYTDIATGCSNSISQSVSVNVIPTVTMSASPNPICNGSSTNLALNFTGTGPWSYSINGAAPVSTSNNPETIPVNPTVTTTYELTTLSDANCNASEWISVAAGSSHALGVKSDGTLWSWGYNLIGQLGLGNNTNSNRPVRVGALNDWAAVSAGDAHSMAIKKNGTLWVWGDNSNGQLANGTFTGNSNTPQQVGSANNWVKADAGNSYCMALKSDGTLWGWGSNVNGYLGDGTNTGRSTPVQAGTDTDWKEISAGLNHTLGLKTNGKLWAWGLGSVGQLGGATPGNSPNQVGLESNWGSICAGEYNSLALKTTGTLWGWGWNQWGELGLGNYIQKSTPTQVGTANNWQSASLYSRHSLAVKQDGTLWSWGVNIAGALGNGTNSSSNSPAQAGVATNWLKLTTGPGFSLGIRSDNTLWAWGKNTDGQLGDGTNVNSLSPLKVNTPISSVTVTVNTLPVVSFSGLAGPYCANASVVILTGSPAGGTFSGPGINGNTFDPALAGSGGPYSITYTYTDMATGCSNSSSQNVTVIPLPVVSFSGLASQYCITSSALTLTGSPAGGTFSGPGINGNTFSPAIASTGGPYTITYAYTDIATGCSNSVSQNVTVKALPTATISATPNSVCVGNTANITLNFTGTGPWTYSINGEAPVSTSNNPETVPVNPVITTIYKLTSISDANCSVNDWLTISTGSYHSLAINSDGTLWAWGRNNQDGQLGDGTIIDKNAPVKIGLSTNWAKVAAGAVHSLGIKTDGTLWAWGANDFGQLGDGTTIKKTNPVQIGTSANWAKIEGGHLYSLAIKTDGTLWAWGQNLDGQLGDGTTTSKYTPVQIGTSTNWVAVSGGLDHSLGIKSDGTLWAWGWGTFGQTGGAFSSVPFQVGTSTDWASIFAGTYYTLGIKTGGTLWALGRNNVGQLGNGNYSQVNSPTQIGTSTDWIKVSGHSAHSMGIKQNGTLWTWGLNNDGQLGNGTITSTNAPAQIGTATNWASISAGLNDSHGIKTGGTIWSWGINDFGQLGDNTNISKTSPVQLNTTITSVTVTVNSLPTVSFSGLAANYCVNASPVTLTGSPAGGTFSGPGISGNVFNPAVAGVSLGMLHIISYSYTDIATGCSNSISQSVIVYPLPVLSIAGLATQYCINASPVTLTGSPAGGTFSGPGISGSTFNPAIAGTGGPYTITYSFTNILTGCSNTVSQLVSVGALPSVSISGNNFVCSGGSALLTAAATAGSGTISSYQWVRTTLAGSTNLGTAATQSINAGGDYTVIVTNSFGCTITSAVFNVTSYAVPSISFSGLASPYCVNAPAVTLNAYLFGNPAQGGIFSGPGITDNGNGTAIFNPATAGAGGPYTIVYSYAFPGTTCSSSTSQTVIVNPLPVVSFNGLTGPYCTTDTVVTLTGIPIGGTFSGPGMVGNTFDPALAGAGTHSITYTYSDGTCINTSTQQVVVNSCITTITVNLKLFLQGYYIDGGIMQPVLNNQSVTNSLSTETDSISVELHDPTTFALVDSKQAVLLTDGNVSATYTQPAGPYFIAVKHRNTIQTWSTDPVACVATTPLYDFTTAAYKAMGDNQVEVQTGKWAFYTGDLNQDDFIDGNDFPAFDTDSFNGVNSVYVATDMNGDGFVDGNDFPVFDVNSFNGVSAVHP